MLKFLQNIVNFILNAILGKNEKQLIVPSIYDQIPDNFHLINEFLDREFYLFLYKITQYQIPIFNELNVRTDIFRNNIVSFILLFSHDSLEESAENKIQRASQIKELFYLEFCNLILSKMSKEIRVLFYRKYQAKHRLSVYRNMSNSEKKIEIRKKVLEKIKQYQKTDDLLDIQNQQIEEMFDKIVLEMKIDMDLGLCEYIIDWVKLKVDFIGDDIKRLLEKRKKEDHIFAEYLDKYTDLIPWGYYDPTFQDITLENTNPLMHDFCINTVHRNYFLKRLRYYFEYNIMNDKNI